MPARLGDLSLDIGPLGAAEAVPQCVLPLELLRELLVRPATCENAVDIVDLLHQLRLLGQCYTVIFADNLIAVPFGLMIVNSWAKDESGVISLRR